MYKRISLFYFIFLYCFAFKIIAQENPNQYVETYGEILGGAPADFNAEERAATKYATNYIKDYDVDEMLYIAISH